MFDKEGKKLLYHGALAWVIAALLGLMLIVLVFKVGMMVGGLKSHYSTCDYKKNFSGHMTGKFSPHMMGKLGAWKKAGYEDFAAKAEAMGMTLAEYKAYLAEQKKQKVE